MFRNDITKMTDKLTSVAAKHNNAMRELSGEQDHLIDKVVSLQNNATELADKLARVAGRPGWGAQQRAGGPQEGAIRSNTVSIMAIIIE